MIGKYNINKDVDILLYGDNLSEEGWKDLGIVFVTNIEDFKQYPNLPIFKYEDFLQTINPIGKHNTRDKILSCAGIETFKQLSDCYNMVRYKVAPFPKRVRDMIVDKYSELVNYGE